MGETLDMLKTNWKRLVAALLFAGSSLIAAHVSADVPADAKANFREKGRVGVIGALTEDMWKGGFVFEHEHFEAQALAHAGLYGHGSRDVHTIFKLGGRVALGTLNYFAFGAEYGPHPGSLDNHVSVGKSFQVGPYLSLQRYFAATPVMLNLWVNPVQYDHTFVNDGAGGREKTNAWHVFQTGGFGIAYLFF
jgi:hypothetical protein